jgi:hypothetical protein
VVGLCEDDAMRINHQVVVFDAPDLAAESGFWAGVLEGTVDAEDDWHMVIEVFQVYADPAGHPFCLCWAAADN